MEFMVIFKFKTMLTIGQKIVTWYIQREESAIKLGIVERGYLVDMLIGAPENTLVMIILERLENDEPYAIINGKNVPIIPSRRMAILLVRGFKSHFLSSDDMGY